MPLLWLSLAFLGGILLSHSITIPLAGWYTLAALGIIFMLPPVSRITTARLPGPFERIPHPVKIPPQIFFPLLIVCFSAGAIRFQQAIPKIDPSFVAYYNDRTSGSIIEGVVITPPDERDTYTNLRINVDQLAIIPDDQAPAIFIPVHGLLLARLPTTGTFSYGDRVRITGELVTPPENEDFSYRDYLAIHGIFSYITYPAVSLIVHGEGNPIYERLYSFRQHALDLLYSIYPDPEASLMAGILLGVQSGIPESVQEAFRLTGTSHIIVISGFNISIIAAMFTFLFSRLLGMWKGFIMTIVGIIMYTLLVGANPAVVRAAILGIIALLGYLLGRQQAGINSLAFVAAIMAVWTPTILWDVSFQLSFAATLGIMLYAEPATRWFNNLATRYTSPDNAQRITKPVSEYILLTLAAQLMTLPLMIYYFNRLSLTSLIANPLILPAQPPLMMLGGMSILAGIVFRPFGQLLAWAAWPFSAYTIRMVEWISRIPHGSIAIGQVGITIFLLFYLVLLSVTFFHGRLIPTARRLTPAVPLVMLGLATFLVWKSAFYSPDGRLHVTVLDVGTGNAVLVQTPGGRSLLINGGPSTITLSDALGRRLPPFQRALDWMVIADIDDEDIKGISGNLERFHPANVLWAGNTSGTRAIADLQSKLISLSIPVTGMQPGQSLELGSGVSLVVTSAGSRGAILLLEWENFRMLLPMGMDLDSLESLQENMAMRSVSVVMLAESGYAPLNPPELITHLNPQLAVISVAAGDKSGLPSQETLHALQGYNVLRTDQNGWIEITTNGKQMWVEVER